MVKLYPRSMEYKVHSLVANKTIGTKLNGIMKEGEMKDCLILEFTDRRYAVFAQSWQKYFYIIMSNLKELNATFTEQLQITEP